MIASVLELSPSPAGWYFAHRLVASAPIRQARPTPSVAEADSIPGEVAILGYGPDGRLRLAAPRPRIWFLA